MTVRSTDSSCPTPSTGRNELIWFLLSRFAPSPSCSWLLKYSAFTTFQPTAWIKRESINMSVCLVCVRLFGFLSNPRSVLHLQHFSALSKNQRVSNWQMGLFGFFLSARGHWHTLGGSLVISHDLLILRAHPPLPSPPRSLLKLRATCWLLNRNIKNICDPLAESPDVAAVIQVLFWLAQKFNHKKC